MSNTRPVRLSDHPFARCLTLLQALGLPGEYVWNVSKTIHEPKDRLEYLLQAISWLRSKIKESPKIPYQRLPVDFHTFVESRILLNKPGILWPPVIKCGADLNSGKYVEAVLTGAIGVAKTTLALYTQAYQLYILSCLRDPHLLFDLDPSSEILIIFQSLNKNLAKDVDYKRFRDMISGSPYFSTEFPYDTSRESDMQFPRNIAVKPVSGEDTAAIGQNVIGGIIDEVNFMSVVEKSKLKRDGSVFDQAAQNYNSIARRRESRFMQLGSLPGMLCLVSSRNYPGGLTDRLEVEARTNKTIYVYDKRIWEIRPQKYSGEMFRLFQGDQSRKPRLLNEEEIVAPEDRHLVMPIPVEFKSKFENDILAAIRDIAGLSTLALHPFILNTDAVVSCFGTVKSIGSRDDCDFVTTKLNIYPDNIEHPEEKRFVHIDLAVTRDSAGVAIGHVTGFKSMYRGNYTEKLPIVQFDLILEVKPPKGGEIEFENIRKLLYTLRETAKLPIKWVSFDQYQSKDSMQILGREGFMVGYQSMDIDTSAYETTKQAFYDGRIKAPAHPKAQLEMITLEMDAKKNKVDHSPTGSKDISDAMAGVVIGLTKRLEIWSRHGVRVSRSVSEALARPTKNSVEAKETAQVDYTTTLRAGREKARAEELS